MKLQNTPLPLLLVVAIAICTTVTPRGCYARQLVVSEAVGLHFKSNKQSSSPLLSEPVTKYSHVFSEPVTPLDRVVSEAVKPPPMHVVSEPVKPPSHALSEPVNPYFNTSRS